MAYIVMAYIVMARRSSDVDPGPPTTCDAVALRELSHQPGVTAARQQQHDADARRLNLPHDLGTVAIVNPQ